MSEISLTFADFNEDFVMKEIYAAPVLEIVEFTLESEFASGGGTNDDYDFDYFDFSSNEKQ